MRGWRKQLAEQQMGRIWIQKGNTHLLLTPSSSDGRGWYGLYTRGGQWRRAPLDQPQTLLPCYRTQPAFWRLEDRSCTRAAWNHRCAALEAYWAHGLTKCVLTQTCHYTRESYAPSSPESYPFFEGHGGRCYLVEGEHAIWAGRSPECLLHRQNSTVYTEAVGGTALLGDAQIDTVFHRLASQPTCRAEVEITARVMMERLSHAGCHAVRCGALTWRRHGSLLHLCLPITGSCDGGDDATLVDATLVAALHPSPAVCGAPQLQSAVARESLDGFTPPWYASAIGWSLPEEAYFLVALRGAYYWQDEAWVTTGVGLVPGFSPEAEWRELEAKQAAWLQAHQA